jgi:hypothetical protein
MSFLRRLFGGGDRDRAADGEPTPEPPTSGPDADAAERQHELEVMREESARLDDLQQRQLRYAHHAWTPPAQGGERRADDEDRAPEG